MFKGALFHRSLYMGILLVLTLTVCGGAAALAAGVAASAPEVTIEALGGVDYDTVTNTTTANTQAKLTDGKITIEATVLSYNASSGEVSATGAVKVTRPEGIYHTDKLLYNIKTETGSSGQFDGVLYNPERNIAVRGTTLDLTRENFRITGGAVTRCPNEKPHYTLIARKITFQNQRVVIQGAVLKIKGIPIFYFPRLSLSVDGRSGHSFPVQFESGSNATDGLWFKGTYNQELNDNLLWYLSGKVVSNRSDSDHQLEMGLSGHGPMSRGEYRDTFSVNKKISGDFKLADSFAYHGPLFSSSADGYYDFSPGNKNEFGLSFTRNYWPSPIGNWQLGIQARRMAAYEGKSNEYGGVFGGYRLDYQPFANLTLSLLRLDDFNGKNNYGDFTPNLGSNIILGVGKTFNANSRFDIAASYNGSTQKLGGQINWNTCCYDSYLGWDAVKQAVTFGLSYHF